jgi:hypothetical protein
MNSTATSKSYGQMELRNVLKLINWLLKEELAEKTAR